MGCSPSKGKLFTGIENHQDQGLQLGSFESSSHHISGGTEILSQTEKEIASSGLCLLQEENTAVQLQGKKPLDCDIVRGSFDKGETNVHLQEELLTKENIDQKENIRIKNNECKRSRQRERLRKTVYMQSNLDLPQAIVKGRQAAYAYLEHNIPKYESLLELLDKATQTQLSIQPMVSLLALQYEEINQTLDEIATEGSQMLEMYGNHVALPEAQNYLLLNPDIPEAERNLTECPPDLMQDMLQHSITQIRLVAESVKGLGDTALGETSDYFASLSQLLAGKLGAKRATESQLKQVLACVESYALGKPNSEDTALQSEDSGIGVENECHNKSVRRCSQEESSASRGSTQSSYGCPKGSLPVQPCVNDNEEDNDKDIDAENSNDDKEPKHKQGSKTDLAHRKISNWSQADHRKYPLQVNFQNERPTISTFQWRDQKERTIRRPKTADDLYVSFQRIHRHSHLRCAQRSRSADCLYSVNDNMVQERNNFSKDNQKSKWITKRQNISQFCSHQDESNGLFKPALTPHLIPVCAPVPPGKNAVRRLINTFSQGVCDSSNQKPLNGLTRYKGMKRGFLPVIPNCRAGVSTNGNNTNSYPLDQQFSERHHDIDMNSLPPPPPEILMDNSFDRNKGRAGGEYGSENPAVRCSTQRKKCYVSHCPRKSVQTISVLQSLDSISGGSQNVCCNGQDASSSEQDSGHQQDKEKNDASGHLQHSQSTINDLYNSSDILAKLCPDDKDNATFLSENAGGAERLGNRYSGEGEASTLCANSYPSPTPSASRVRIPPSSFSTFHRGPSSTVNGQRDSSTASFTSQVQRATWRDSEDENGLMTASNSMSFYDTYSVFCQENQSASQSVKPSCRSTLPRPWGEPKVSRERLQAAYLPQSLKRNIPYRPTLTEHQLLLPSETSTINDGR